LERNNIFAFCTRQAFGAQEDRCKIFFAARDGDITIKLSFIYFVTDTINW
jgi:hypothetical protein